LTHRNSLEKGKDRYVKDIDASNWVDQIWYAYTNCDSMWEVMEPCDLHLVFHKKKYQ
jgi:hypothetical protein